MDKTNSSQFEKLENGCLSFFQASMGKGRLFVFSFLCVQTVALTSSLAQAQLLSPKLNPRGTVDSKSLNPPTTASSGQTSEQFAQIYVDQYFDPPTELLLSKQGAIRAEALAHFTVGRLQENRNDFEEAIASYRRVLQLQPEQLKLTRETAQMLARAGRQTEGLALLETGLEKNPAQVLSYIMLSEFLSIYHGNSQEKKEQSLELAKQAVSKFPKHPFPYEHLTRLYLNGNRKQNARDLLSKGLLIDSNDSQFWLRLGGVAKSVWPPRNSSSLTQLNQFFDKATSNAGNDDEVKIKAGDFYSETKQWDRAETLYRSTIERQTDNLNLRRKLANVYLKKGDSKAYQQILQKILEFSPRDLETHRALAENYKKNKDVLNYAKHQRLFLKIGTGKLRDYITLAREMVAHYHITPEDRIDLDNRAVSFIEEAAYLFPDEPIFLLLITDPLSRLDRRKEATKYFAACEVLAKKNNPDLLTSGFYFNFGANTEQHGDIDRAGKLFQTSIKTLAKENPNPKDEKSKGFQALVLNYLGYMWVENDMNIVEGGKLIKEAALLDPNSGAIADSLGWYHFKVGEFDDALKELLRSEELISRSPREQMDPVIFDHIGRTYHKLGNSDKAIEYMKRTLEATQEGDPKKGEYTDRLNQYQKAKPLSPNSTKPAKTLGQ